MNAPPPSLPLLTKKLYFALIHNFSEKKTHLVILNLDTKADILTLTSLKLFSKKCSINKFSNYTYYSTCNYNLQHVFTLLLYECEPSLSSDTVRVDWNNEISSVKVIFIGIKFLRCIFQALQEFQSVLCL